MSRRAELAVQVLVIVVGMLTAVLTVAVILGLLTLAAVGVWSAVLA